jgi:hypothetical protein
VVSRQLPAALKDIDASSDTKAVTIDIGFADLLFDTNCSTASATTCPFAANLTTILTGLKGALANDPGDETRTTARRGGCCSGATARWTARAAAIRSA